jgi:hypothetical protein
MVLNLARCRTEYDTGVSFLNQERSLWTGLQNEDELVKGQDVEQSSILGNFRELYKL